MPANHPVPQKKNNCAAASIELWLQLLLYLWAFLIAIVLGEKVVLNSYNMNRIV